MNILLLGFIKQRGRIDPFFMFFKVRNPKTTFAHPAGDKKDEILTFYMNFFFDFSILKKVSFTIDIRVIKI
jgi:hypothetical protein